MGLLYNIGIRLYELGIGIAALSGNPKARLWRDGRRGLLEKIEHDFARGRESNERVVWIHAASLGEFEQARPIIERLREERAVNDPTSPDMRIVVTFFSPSGYEVRKAYPHADHILYLPMDRPGNVRRFLDAVCPDVAIFIKYEFWLNYLDDLHRRNIPTYLVSAIFRPTQIHFRPWGRRWRKALRNYATIFVQDEASRRLLESAGCRRCVVSGDTRFDRVASIARAAKRIEAIEHFRGDYPLFVAGSTWAKDETLIIELANRHPAIRFVIAPHEIDDRRIAHLEHSIVHGALRYTRYNTKTAPTAQVLILDTIGLLSSAYGYARWAYIGGGFGVGIHNTLEAATFGLPLAFGPNYRKFREACDLISAGAATSITGIEELEAWFAPLVNDTQEWQKASSSARRYTEEQCGATDAILSTITSAIEHL